MKERVREKSLKKRAKLIWKERRNVWQRRFAVPRKGLALAQRTKKCDAYSECERERALGSHRLRPAVAG